MAIPFTQYKLPNGRKVPVTIERSEDVELKAGVIISHGYVFETELVGDSTVSLTIADPAKGEDVAIELVENGPGVGDAVDRLVRNFKVPTA